MRTRKNYTRKGLKSHFRAVSLLGVFLFCGASSVASFDFSEWFAEGKPAKEPSASSKRRIHEGQYLLIRVSEPAKTSQTEIRRVDSEGMIYLSLAGGVRVIGFTVEETEKLIRNRIPDGKSSRVSVRVSVIEDRSATKSLS